MKKILTINIITIIAGYKRMIAVLPGVIKKQSQKLVFIPTVVKEATTCFYRSYKTIIAFFAICFTIIGATEIVAQSVETRLGAIEKELESLKLVRATNKYQSYKGLGPSASGVYHSDGGLSIGGYGEIKYSHYPTNDKKDTVDIHRFILYAGYRFNDYILLNTEIEIEHVSEVFVEFAYVDILLHPAFSLSAGLNLIPVGITNYMHEPTTFYSVNRPQTERNIIPSTWRENGIVISGDLEEGLFSYKLGVFNGGNASKFRENSWMRSGRQKGSVALAEDFAFVANIELQPMLALGLLNSELETSQLGDLRLGASYYVADNGQGYEISGETEENASLNGMSIGRARVHLAEVHLLYQWGPVNIRGLFARGQMNDEDTRAVNRAVNKNIGKVVQGWYLEAAVDVFAFFSQFSGHKLNVFARYESFNTQVETVTCPANSGDCNRADGVIAGDFDTSNTIGVANPGMDRTLWVYGLAYFPHPNVVFKLDLESWDTGSNASSKDELSTLNNEGIDRVNVSVGWIF